MSISSLCKSGTPNADSAVLAPPAIPRLLYAASTKSQGGIETHSVEMAAALAASGVTVRFACRPDGLVETLCRRSGLPTDSLTVRNSGDFSAARRLAWIIERERIDIVHVHSRRDYVAAVLGVALARRCLRRQIGLVLHAHMIRPLGTPGRLAGRFFEWGANAVIGVSGAVCDHLREAHRFDPHFIHLIPNGIALARFAAPGSPEALRQRVQERQNLGIPENALVLGMIGRLDAKGQRQILTILPELAAFCPGLFVVLIGSEGKPGEHAVLTAKAEASGLRDRVVFTGPRTDIPALLTAVDILVHLPVDEAFGLALAEAMAAGLPTVATAIGGCREVVRSGVTGRLVTPSDAGALLDALTWLLDPALGPERRAEMGAAGRSVVQSEFTRDLQIERLLTLYHELCPVLE